MNRLEFEMRLMEKAQEANDFERRIREISAPAIAYTIYPDTPKTKTMRHNLQLLGIYRLPGDKPLIHNGRKPR